MCGEDGSYSGTLEAWSRDIAELNRYNERSGLGNPVGAFFPSKAPYSLG